MLTHFRYQPNAQGERAIYLAAPCQVAPGLTLPLTVATIRANQTLTLSEVAVLSAADLRLLSRLTANYPAAKSWLEQHTPHWEAGAWHALPTLSVA